MPYPDLLVRGPQNVATYSPFELWAGESDLVTSQGTASAALQQFQVIARDPATQKIIPWDGSTGKPIGFMAQAAAANGPAAYFTGGVPNHLALVWPPSVSTLDQRKAAFDGSNIVVGSIL